MKLFFCACVGMLTSFCNASIKSQYDWNGGGGGGGVDGNVL